MSVQAFVAALLVGSGAIGLWTAVRYPHLAPRTAGRAFLFLLVALIVPALAPPLLALTLPVLPPAAAVLLSVLPVFVAAFTLKALVVRFAIGLLGSGLR
jgi:hypothetical protein